MGDILSKTFSAITYTAPHRIADKMANIYQKYIIFVLNSTSTLPTSAEKSKKLFVR